VLHWLTVEVFYRKCLPNHCFQTFHRCCTFCPPISSRGEPKVVVRSYIVYRRFVPLLHHFNSSAHLLFWSRYITPLFRVCLSSLVSSYIYGACSKKNAYRLNFQMFIFNQKRVADETERRNVILESASWRGRGLGEWRPRHARDTSETR